MHRDEQVKVNRSLAWVGTASALIGASNIFVMGALFAAFITPQQYGVVTLALAAFPILDLATDMGLMAAIIQGGEHTPARLSTIFWINLGLAVLLVLGVSLLLAPWLAAYYGEPIVGQMLQAYCLKLLLQNTYYIPAALMNRELRFSELSLVRVVAHTCEMIALFAIAATSLGVWCFVIAALVRAGVTAIGLQWYQPWLPRLQFDWHGTRGWIAFGLKTSLSRLPFFVYTGLDFYVVGAYFGREALGLYKAAADLALDPARVLGQIVVSVAFPAFSRARDPAAVGPLFLQFARVNFIVTGGFLVGVMVAAPDLLHLLDVNWTPAGDAVRILGLAALLRALSLIVPPLLDGLGKPTLTLVYMSVAAVSMPACFVLAAALAGDWLGFESVAWAWTLGYPIAFAVLLRFALKLLHMPVRAYARAIAPLLLWAAIAVAVGLAARTLVAPDHHLLRATVGLLAAAAAYLGLLAGLERVTPATLRAALRKPASPPG